MSPITKVVGVGTEERMVFPAVAVHAVLVLGARGSEMPDLVASVAMRPGLNVLRAVGMNVPSVTTHGAEVVHVDDWRGGGTCGGVLVTRRLARSPSCLSWMTAPMLHSGSFEVRPE